MNFKRQYYTVENATNTSKDRFHHVVCLASSTIGRMELFRTNAMEWTPWVCWNSSDFSTIQGSILHVSSFSFVCSSGFDAVILKVWTNQILHSQSVQDERRTLRSKEDVTLFIYDKSVDEKKPFIVSKSEHRRYTVVCPHDYCTFKVSFYQRIDGVFYITKSWPHTCDSLSPAKRRIWIASKAKEALLEKPSVTPSEVMDLVKKKHKITIDLATLSVPLRRVRLHARGGTLSFGHIASVFEILSSTNEGT